MCSSEPSMSNRRTCAAVVVRRAGRGGRVAHLQSSSRPVACRPVAQSPSQPFRAEEHRCLWGVALTRPLDRRAIKLRTSAHHRPSPLDTTARAVYPERRSPLRLAAHPFSSCLLTRHSSISIRFDIVSACVKSLPCITAQILQSWNPGKPSFKS